MLEYLERTVGVNDETLTDEQHATIDRRAAEMDAAPTLDVLEGEFFAHLEAKWL